MYTDETITETRERSGFSQDGTPYAQDFDYAFEDLSAEAKEMVRKCHKATLTSPLTYCRMLQEECTVKQYNALVEAEHYLINE
jgi:lipid II:glycine glycyltransferase (peptidoglycan interpeptide bridge formation enzyme)